MDAVEEMLGNQKVIGNRILLLREIFSLPERAVAQIRDLDCWYWKTNGFLRSHEPMIFCQWFLTSLGSQERITVSLWNFPCWMRKSENYSKISVIAIIYCFLKIREPEICLIFEFPLYLGNKTSRKDETPDSINGIDHGIQRVGYH